MMNKDLYAELRKEGYSEEDKYFHDLELEQSRKADSREQEEKLPPLEESKDPFFVEPDPLAKRLGVNTHWVP